MVASEIQPLAKTGGLADVAGALIKALSKLGNKVVGFMPYYKPVLDKKNLNIKKTKFEFEVFVGNQAKRCEVFKTKLPKCKKGDIYLIYNEEYFNREGLYMKEGSDYPDNDERFIFFSRAVLELIKQMGEYFDIIHTNDWQTALIPAYLKSHLYNNEEVFKNTKIVFTIHNLAYQGLFPADTIIKTGLGWDYFNSGSLEFWGHVNFIKGGIVYADVITTVSPTYAKEIQTPEFGHGLDGLLSYRSANIVGILNGIDTDVWSPKVDDFIFEKYSVKTLNKKVNNKVGLQKQLGLEVNENIPLLGIISRITDQKGLDLIIGLKEFFLNNDLQLVVLGTGDPYFENQLKEMAIQAPNKISVNIMFSEELAHKIEAGSDIFLMPSKFEPCGLNQMYSLMYGTIPIVRNTGGLADTIVDTTFETIITREATGFKFYEYSVESFKEAVSRALFVYNNNKEIWRQIQITGMEQDFSWEKSAKEYLNLYESLLKQ